MDYDIRDYGYEIDDNRDDPYVDGGYRLDD
jgi:hypothetical protein